MNAIRDAVLASFADEWPQPVALTRLITDVGAETGATRLEVQQVVYTMIAGSELVAGTGREMAFTWSNKRDNATYVVPAAVAEQRTAEHSEYMLRQRITPLRVRAERMATAAILERYADEWRDLVEAEILRAAPEDIRAQIADHIRGNRPATGAGGRA